MRERIEKVEFLREKLYMEISAPEREELDQLEEAKLETKEDSELKKINIQIDELNLYLEQLREDSKSMGVGEVDEVPKCLNERV